MRRISLVSCLFLCAFTTKTDISTDPKKLPVLLSNNSASPAAVHLVDSLYSRLQLEEAGLNKQAFFNAYKGYQYLLGKNKLANKDYLTICDYSQPSRNKRLYVIDLKNNAIVYNTYVAHGRNSGADMPKSFSNANSCNKSSLGFLVTAETYTGHNGYSMRFDGQERGFNDNVRMRDVVMHGSQYVNAERAKNGTMMGRSFGCPAVPAEECAEIINTIKGGSCFYIYSPDAYYTHHSTILNSQFDLQGIPTLPMLAVAAPAAERVATN